MRIALQIAYDGTKFHGSAYQPNQQTVEGELEERLLDMGAITDKSTANLRMASRTDRDVSAAGNVCALTTEMDPTSLMSGLIHTLQDIWAVGMAIVSEEFNPRHTRHKSYRYFVPEKGLNTKAMHQAATVFIGRHDFSAFARVDRRNPLRTIIQASVEENEIPIITFTGPSFLWFQVRRMVAAVVAAGQGEASPSDIARVLREAEATPWGTAPPQYLLLTSICYEPAIQFQPLKEGAFGITLRAQRMAARSRLFHEMAGIVQNSHRNK